LFCSVVNELSVYIFNLRITSPDGNDICFFGKSCAAGTSFLTCTDIYLVIWNPALWGRRDFGHSFNVSNNLHIYTLKFGLSIAISKEGFLLSYYDNSVEDNNMTAYSKDFAEANGNADHQISEDIYKIYFNDGNAKMLIAEDLTILLVNKEFEKLTGYFQSKIIGGKLVDYLDQMTANRLLKFLPQIITGASLKPKRIATKIMDRQGKRLDVQLSVSHIKEKNEILFVISDLTEINRLHRKMEAISACNSAIIKESNETDLIHTICTKLVETGGYRLAWVGIVDKDPEQHLRPIGKAGYDEGYVEDIHAVLTDPVKGNGPACLAIKKNKTYICKDTSACPNFAPWRDKALSRGYISFVAIPFILPDFDSKGVVCVYSGDANSFDDNEIEMLEELVSGLSYGMNARRNVNLRNEINEQLRKNVIEKHKLLLQTVPAFASIIEVRDPYTAGHQKNVTNLSVCIANEMELSNQDLEAVFVAAAMHDIGKIGVPSEILSKPGKLSNLEFAFIKEHARVGHDIISQIDFPWPIADIILQHHERLDGSGYPNGLKGSEIHLIARIIGVADTVDAMASHRPYRAALGIEKALEEIERLKGIKYDPDVVDACLILFRVKGYRITKF